jgi:hypothetical protein
LPPAGPPPARTAVLKPFALAPAASLLDGSSSSSSSKSEPSGVVLLGSSQAYALFAAERFALLCAALAAALHAPPPAPTQAAAAVPAGAVLLLLEMVAAVSPGGRSGGPSGSGGLASTLVADLAGGVPAVAMRALLPGLRCACLKLALSLTTVPGVCPGPLLRRARRLAAAVRRLAEPALPPPLPLPPPGAPARPADLAALLRTAMAPSSNSSGGGLPLACAVLCQLSGGLGGAAALELVAAPALSRLVHGLAYALAVSKDSIPGWRIDSFRWGWSSYSPELYIRVCFRPSFPTVLCARTLKMLCACALCA